MKKKAKSLSNIYLPVNTQMTHSLRGKRVLVVDDEPLLREVMRDDLELFGVEVLEAINGRDAFELLQSIRVDVIITDVRMPGGSGLELLSRVRGTQPASANPSTDRAPLIILLSGHQDVSEYQSILLGANAFFQKPCACEILVDKILALLNPERRPSAPHSTSTPTTTILGNETIDEAHERLFQLINNLQSLGEIEKNYRIVAVGYLNQLAQYPATHFPNEEAVMEQIAYPDLSQHKILHEELRKAIVDFREQYLAGKCTLSAESFGSLRDWLQSHVQEVDADLEKHILRSPR